MVSLAPSASEDPAASSPNILTQPAATKVLNNFVNNFGRIAKLRRRNARSRSSSHTNTFADVDPLVLSTSTPTETRAFTLSLRPKTQIFIKLLTSETITLDVAPTETIYSVQRKIEGRARATSPRNASCSPAKQVSFKSVFRPPLRTRRIASSARTPTLEVYLPAHNKFVTVPYNASESFEVLKHQVEMRAGLVGCEWNFFVSAVDLENENEVEMDCFRALGGPWVAKQVPKEVAVEDPKHTLAKYQIKSGSTIHMVYALQGGGSRLPGMEMMGVEFADLSAPGGTTRIELSNNAPRGRYVVPGTNIEMQCRCTSYQGISQLGLCLFDLVYDGATVYCPNCDVTGGKLVTDGFYLCECKIHGLKAGRDGPEPFETEWTRVGNDDAYQLFDTSKNVGKATWLRLIIDSKRLDSGTPCSICLETLGGETEALKCRHTFHKACVEAWRKKKPTCPMCRAGM
ncbi:hypothetical protein M427DRAFT_42342 [Gonapodya prolifera JEL478]|uniref:RING-type domain-containing protein n=1 Tax=Gonapodya prolifera (strain JEL478) TaxID=1344416 RepID=A0A139API6_GONPJ|nr:hypothetical protein M427DRAFT_42342 [Gonapodya prolifera JEL478]|eukprot:KXS18671.1 hypothetical protein M427DRAFT_42342 [Gonapodya prolifera JEL478]